MYTWKYRIKGGMCLTSILSQSMKPRLSHFPSAPIKLPCNGAVPTPKIYRPQSNELPPNCNGMGRRYAFTTANGTQPGLTRNGPCSIHHEWVLR